MNVSCAFVAEGDGLVCHCCYGKEIGVAERGGGDLDEELPWTRVWDGDGVDYAFALFGVELACSHTLWCVK